MSWKRTRFWILRHPELTTSSLRTATFEAFSHSPLVLDTVFGILFFVLRCVVSLGDMRWVILHVAKLILRPRSLHLLLSLSAIQIYGRQIFISVCFLGLSNKVFLALGLLLLSSTIVAFRNICNYRRFLRILLFDAKLTKKPTCTALPRSHPNAISHIGVYSIGPRPDPNLLLLPLISELHNRLSLSFLFGIISVNHLPEVLIVLDHPRFQRVRLGILSLVKLAIRWLHYYISQ